MAYKIHMIWYNSPGHHANYLASDYSSMAVAVYYYNGVWYEVENFILAGSSAEKADETAAGSESYLAQHGYCGCPQCTYGYYTGPDNIQICNNCKGVLTYDYPSTEISILAQKQAEQQAREASRCYSCGCSIIGTTCSSPDGVNFTCSNGHAVTSIQKTYADGSVCYVPAIYYADDMSTPIY